MSDENTYSVNENSEANNTNEGSRESTQQSRTDASTGSRRPRDDRGDRGGYDRGDRGGYDRDDRGDREDYGGRGRGGDRDDRGGYRGGGRGRSYFKRKVCRFCTQNLVADYKNADLLRRFVTERGKILPRRITGTCAKHQRVLSVQIKRARTLAFLPFTKQ